MKWYKVSKALVRSKILTVTVYPYQDAEKLSTNFKDASSVKYASKTVMAVVKEIVISEILIQFSQKTLDMTGNRDMDDNCQVPADHLFE